jgi:DNA-binding response OmpR family regulator
MKVLLVEDDVDLLDVTTYALRREGFNVLTATDGAQALRVWEADEPSVVVLDVGLPRLNGFEVCRTIRQGSSTPIILLTGLTGSEYVVKGFRLGADDYVTKPFSTQELALRIRALWRRTGHRAETEPARELCLGGLTLDVESHEIRHGDWAVRLTPIEFRLLYMLAMNAGKVVSSARLLDYGWGYQGSDVSVLKAHISHARKKLRQSPEPLGDIISVPHVGYWLCLAAGSNGRAA